MWLFGYASLIYRVNFRYEKKVIGRVKGYSRRFYQLSVYHRGTPSHPGRIATLVPNKEDEVWGVAYEITSDCYNQIRGAMAAKEYEGFKMIGIAFSTEKVRNVVFEDSMNSSRSSSCGSLLVVDLRDLTHSSKSLQRHSKEKLSSKDLPKNMSSRDVDKALKYVDKSSRDADKSSRDIDQSSKDVDKYSRDVDKTSKDKIHNDKSLKELHRSSSKELHRYSSKDLVSSGLKVSQTSIGGRKKKKKDGKLPKRVESSGMQSSNRIEVSEQIAKHGEIRRGENQRTNEEHRNEDNQTRRVKTYGSQRSDGSLRTNGNQSADENQRSDGIQKTDIQKRGNAYQPVKGAHDLDTIHDHVRSSLYEPSPDDNRNDHDPEEPDDVRKASSSGLLKKTRKKGYLPFENQKIHALHLSPSSDSITRQKKKHVSCVKLHDKSSETLKRVKISEDKESSDNEVSHEAIAFIGSSERIDIEDDVVFLVSQIASAKGLAGSNVWYVLKLAQAVRDLEHHDEYLFEVESKLMKHLEKRGRKDEFILDIHENTVWFEV